MLRKKTDISGRKNVGNCIFSSLIDLKSFIKAKNQGLKPAENLSPAARTPSL